MSNTTIISTEITAEYLDNQWQRFITEPLPMIDFERVDEHVNDKSITRLLSQARSLRHTDPNQYAVIHRQIGDIYITWGNIDLAHVHYENANRALAVIRAAANANSGPL